MLNSIATNYSKSNVSYTVQSLTVNPLIRNVILVILKKKLKKIRKLEIALKVDWQSVSKKRKKLPHLTFYAGKNFE